MAAVEIRSQSRDSEDYDYSNSSGAATLTDSVEPRFAGTADSAAKRRA
jgi:hypothetical protein